MEIKHKHYKFQVVVDITITKNEEDDPPTREEVEVGVIRQLPGYDNVVKGNVKVGKVVVKD